MADWERGRIPCTLLAAQNHRDCESIFSPGPSAAPWGGHLKALSELGCLHELCGQHTPTARHRVWLVSTLADPAFSRSSPRLLFLSTCSEVMERFPWKVLGSWQGRVRTSLLCSTTPIRIASGAPLLLTFACKTHSSALAQFWFHVYEVLFSSISPVDEDRSFHNVFVSAPYTHLL